MAQKMSSATSKEYITDLDKLSVLTPETGDRCESIHGKVTSLMSNSDAVKSVILLGDHFLPENKEISEETFPSIEVLIVSAGDDNDNKQYRDRYHKDYVLSFWDEGIYGNIDAVSEEEIENRGGILEMLIRGDSVAKNIPKRV